MTGPKPILPDLRSGALLDGRAKAHVAMCWTCGTCDGECPVNEASNRLRPRKIVRMAVLGLVEELAELREIWYCIGCNRCGQTCPTGVAPSKVISRAKEEALRRGVLSRGVYDAYRAFFSAFQRVRWHAVSRCFNEELTRLSDRQWREWLDTPIPGEPSLIAGNHLTERRGAVADTVAGAETLSCFACGECISACPLMGERTVFDPLWITRMANLGAVGELLRSPVIWLCLQCLRCGEACPQAVKAHALIQGLRELAVEQGIVGPGFRDRVRSAYRILYARFVEEVDRILGPGAGDEDGPDRRAS